ncbi:6-phosphogluconate dehydrogenase, decarboxylating 3 [Tanacetum coccineum]
MKNISTIELRGLHVIGQNLAINFTDRGFNEWEFQEGESDARSRPSSIVGGNLVAYEKVKHVLFKMARINRDKEKCVAYVGLDGWGHYVHMVNNEIAYAQMNIIVECYDVLESIVKLPRKELHDFFGAWNKGELLKVI